MSWLDNKIKLQKSRIYPRYFLNFSTSHLLKVCLQFPDHLLPDSTQIALALESQLQQTFYVMADTAYER